MVKKVVLAAVLVLVLTFPAAAAVKRVSLSSLRVMQQKGSSAIPMRESPKLIKPAKFSASLNSGRNTPAHCPQNLYSIPN